MNNKTPDPEPEDFDYLSTSQSSQDPYSRGGSVDAGNDFDMSSRNGFVEEGDDDRYFAKQENRRVHGIKVVALVMLFIVAVAVSAGVYYGTARGQQDEFQTSFEGKAEKVKTSFQEVLEQKVAAIASLGVTFTAYQANKNATWPFVTLTDFQERAAAARVFSKAKFLELLPIVSDEDREAWEVYSVENQEWTTEGREYQARNDLYPKTLEDETSPYQPSLIDTEPDLTFGDRIFTLDDEGNRIDAEGEGPFYPVWQSSPVFPALHERVNEDLKQHPRYGPYIEKAAESGQIALGGLDIAEVGDVNSPDALTSFFSFVRSYHHKEWLPYVGDPMSSVYVPVFDSFDDGHKPVAVLFAIFGWGSFFENILPPHHKPVDVVLRNTCDGESPSHGEVTFKVTGKEVSYLGPGDLADQKYAHMRTDPIELNTTFVIGPTTVKLTMNEDLCKYSMMIYPTIEIDEFYNDWYPLHIALVVAASFIFTAVVFLIYDSMVEKRQKRVLDTAKRSTALVSSIFPRGVRDQLMGTPPVQGNATKLRSMMSRRTNNSSHRTDGDIGDMSGRSTIDGNGGGPIADLFPECTVMFADVEGFTAWSSTREPSHVFQLLESIYAAFDRVAHKRRVFKVETVGDCYVAVSGLPEPCANHALKMASFARDCIHEHIAATQKLEVSLGPDTGDLKIRIGLNSGPITAGVLRGERSRFQLFGDTVNTGSRIESSGVGNQVHLSEQTAEIIKNAGHANWVQERGELVQLKGKGALKTYWLVTGPRKLVEASTVTMFPSQSVKAQSALVCNANVKKQRYVEWNVDILLRIIKQIVWSRQSRKSKVRNQHTGDFDWTSSGGSCPRDEIVEIVKVTDRNILKQDCIDPHAALSQDITLDAAVVIQTRALVVKISEKYEDNPFHNFEHASHVTMSVTKLLSRIVAPSDMDFKSGAKASAWLQDHTFGITSDPLNQFACIFSALIHDVDHQGVSNMTLVKEEDPLVTRYNGKSPAEQNSVDMAWDMLLSDDFVDLRAVLCSNAHEMSRFRQLVVNSVMATDIFDPDLKKLRNARWETAFQQPTKPRSSIKNAKMVEESIEHMNRKATIVIEHLIQASDVSHTMQHWSVYQKWNRRLYHEMCDAHRSGRASASDPSEFWYEGELKFFDFYIIPLAKKLKDCGVFGVASDEYLNYALSNRDEWEKKGKRIVAELKKQALCMGSA